MLETAFHPLCLMILMLLLSFKIEFNMMTGKKDKYIEPFSKMVPLFHSFERGVVEKSVLVFAKTIEEQNAAVEAGARRREDKILLMILPR